LPVSLKAELWGRYFELGIGEALEDVYGVEAHLGIVFHFEKNIQYLN
jgi:hypothetical protein